MASPTKGKEKSNTLCQAATSYKKKNGQLILTKSNLIWSLQGSTKADGELNFDIRRLNSLFMSKEGGAKVVLRVGVLDLVGGTNEENYNFTFTSGPSAVSDREHFKREISQIIARNKQTAQANLNSLSNAPSPAGTAATAAPSGPFNGLPSPAQLAASVANSMSGRASPAPASPGPSGAASGAAGAAASANDPTKDFQIRQKILNKNPELMNLHVELVRTGQISEEEFWEGREYLLLAEQIHAAQRQGKSAQLVDPKFESTEAGEIKIKLSGQLIRDIFEQYPIVAKIYNENVPEPLAEAEFWHRYFHSKLFDRHRSSGRTSHLSAGNVGGGALKDDIIFDRYLEDEDDDLEPKHARDDDVYRLLDLAATEEDHMETGNTKDFTMRAGSQRKSLPLMRKFNEHSERLLVQAMGAQERRNLGHAHGGDAGSRKYYDDILIDDLQGETPDEAIPLEVRDQDAYEGMGSTGSDPNKDSDDPSASAVKKRKLTQDEVEEIWSESQHEIENWHPDLGRFHFSRKSANTALASLQTNITSRLSLQSSGNSSSAYSKEFPEAVLRSMLSAQTSTNEFLRHFWSAMLPPNPNDYSAAALSTPMQKANKVNRMLGYLEKSKERVDSIVKEAEGKGADPVAVRAALGPTLEAVRKAQGFYQSKLKKS